MKGSDKKSTFLTGATPKVKVSGPGSNPSPPAPEVDSAQTVIAAEDHELKAWRESLRPHLGGQRPGTLASGVDTLRNRESFKPSAMPRPLPRDVSETVAIQDIARVSQKKPSPKALLPMRTWALLGATVLVAVYVFLLDDSGERPAASSQPQPVAPQSANSAPPVATKPQPSPTDVSKPAVVVAAETAKPSETKPRGSINEDDTKEADESESEDERKVIGDVLEARAAAYWIAGDMLKALPLYKQLAQQQPEQPVYSLMVDILRRQMVETCQAGQDPC
jgi:hypothetical protein